jgi:DNA-directed RNA polymerase subunit alpha
MLEKNISLPSKPRIVTEQGNSGAYEIDGLYPGYGHTLGNSLRRIILSSLPGAAITHVKIKGVEHEFSTIEGVKQDVISIILNLKKVRMVSMTDEGQVLTIKKKGIGAVTAADIKVPGQVTIVNPDQHIADITDKSTELDIELTIQNGIGYVPKEELQRERVDIGAIALDASFAPIRRVNYEVENMRVGDRTDFNRLRVFIETNGAITPKEALESAVDIMISQLKAIVGFKESHEEDAPAEAKPAEKAKIPTMSGKEDYDDILKTRIESLELPARIINALTAANIRTVGGLARKKGDDVLALEGIGEKGLTDIKKVLTEFGISLK